MRPEYLQWVVNVQPNTSPGTLMRVVRQQTSDTLAGRRHAILGIATGAITLALCCAIGVIAGVAGSTDR